MLSSTGIIRCDFQVNFFFLFVFCTFFLQTFFPDFLERERDTERNRKGGEIRMR